MFLEYIVNTSYSVNNNSRKPAIAKLNNKLNIIELLFPYLFSLCEFSIREFYCSEKNSDLRRNSLQYYEQKLLYIYLLEIIIINVKTLLYAITD